ncbi:MAG TPA: hypothetical protein VMX54_16080, partial [Vicinamibacteria bacterium]|nr:hypothetical protein [Vicinamibacteria bacterium]
MRTARSVSTLLRPAHPRRRHPRLLRHGPRGGRRRRRSPCRADGPVSTRPPPQASQPATSAITRSAMARARASLLPSAI